MEKTFMIYLRCMLPNGYDLSTCRAEGQGIQTLTTDRREYTGRQQLTGTAIEKIPHIYVEHSA